MSKKPVIAAIAAMARNRVIGRDNKMPWHIPEEFRHFRRTTMGKPVIMGRRTWESLGALALPGRTCIIVSRSPQNVTGDGIAVGAVADAVALAMDIATDDGVDEIFIAGGAQIFKESLPLIQRFYLSVIDADYDGDAFLDIDFSNWHETARQSHLGPPSFVVKTLEQPDLKPSKPI